jgi:hypothetical protein
MRKILLVFALLLLPGFALADIVYQRNPATYYVPTDFSVSVSAGNFEELCSDDPTPWNYTGWTIEIGGNPQTTQSEVVSTTTLTHTFSFTEPCCGYDPVEPGVFQYVIILCKIDNIADPDLNGVMLEYNDNENIFEVLESQKILNVPGSMATGMLAYAGQLFTDFRTWILLICGLPIGFWILNKVLRLIKPKI